MLHVGVHDVADLKVAQLELLPDPGANKYICPRLIEVLFFGHSLQKRAASCASVRAAAGAAAVLLDWIEVELDGTLLVDGFRDVTLPEKSSTNLSDQTPGASECTRTPSFSSLCVPENSTRPPSLRLPCWKSSKEGMGGEISRLSNLARSHSTTSMVLWGGRTVDHPDPIPALTPFTRDRGTTGKTCEARCATRPPRGSPA